MGGALLAAAWAVACAGPVLAAEDPPEGEAPRWLWLPESEIFPSVIADPHDPGSYTTYLRMDTKYETTDIGSVSFGDSFPLVRRESTNGTEFQVGVSAAAISFFNFDGTDNDLVNTDFVVGLPVSIRSEDWSSRLRFFHQSSHVEDRFLLNQTGTPTEKLSIEVVELLASWEHDGLRLYGGGSYIYHTPHEFLDRHELQAGVELRHPLNLHARLVGALDASFREQNDWQADLYGKLGFEFAGDSWDTRIGVFLEYFHGHIPFGQFYEFRADWVGIGVTLAF